MLGPLNPGVSAVVGFYLISGYVMTGLVLRHFGRPADAPRFYTDRALRLMPQYLAIAAVTLVWQLASDARTEFLHRLPSGVDLLNNLLVVPLNFYMYNGAHTWTLIPPAWSLGAEIQFYLLAPFLILWPRLGLALASLSLAVHGAALAGVLHADWYGYRLLPGVLWVFMAGSLLFRLQRAQPRLAAAMALAAPLCALAIGAWLRREGLLAHGFNRELLIGWGAGLPLLHLVSGWQSKPGGPARLDALAGDLSYGVFLNHFLLIWVLLPRLEPGPAALLALVAASLSLSWLTQRVFERPALALRRRLRVSSTG